MTTPQQNTDAIANSSENTLPAGRRAGVSLHITALPGPYGIGEIGPQAREFIDTLRRAELAVWQFLPTGPTAYGDSPYQPLSTFAGNEMLISIAELIDMKLLTPDEAGELSALPDRRVDFGALIPIKTRLLRTAARRFFRRADKTVRKAYIDFIAENDESLLRLARAAPLIL